MPCSFRREDSATHVAHAAAHSARHPIDEEEEEKQWSQADNQVPEVVVFLVVITERTDFLLLDHLVAIPVYFVHRTELYFYVWVRSHVLCAHLIYIASIFRVDVYFKRIFCFVSHYAQYIAFVNILFEFCVRCFFGSTSA